MKNTTRNFLQHNSIFGLFIGGSYIITSLIFIWSGKNIALNAQLNNIIMMLTIAGIFIGVKKYRDECLAGVITYGKSLTTGIYMLGIAAFLYALYIFILYTADPEQMEQFRKIMLATMKQIYGNTSFYGIIEESYRSYLFPISIAFGEFINKLFFGLIFTLVLAGILRKSISPFNH